MLKEDQVIELLARCEIIVGKRLDSVRGQLKVAESRSAAIWELLGIEVFSRHFSFEYEPPGDSRPDLLIPLEGQSIAVDFTFLYPRFWRNSRKRYQVTVWIRNELVRVGIDPIQVAMAFHGKKSPDGYVQVLPELHEKSKIVHNEVLKVFVNAVRDSPDSSCAIKLEPYDIELQYIPSRSGEFYSSTSTVEEANAAPQRTAIYRKISDKAGQHKLNTPLFLFIGGDDKSSIMSRMSDWHHERAAVFAALDKYRAVSGICVSRLEWNVGFGPLKATMESKFYLNSYARLPVPDKFITKLQQLTFNRWRYTFALPEWEDKQSPSRRGLGGPLTMSEKADGNIVLSVPGSIVLESLQGKSNLYDEYPCNAGEWPRAFFDRDREIVGVRIRTGEIEKGEESMIEFTLAPRPERVFK